MTRAVAVRSFSPGAEQMRRSDRQRHHAKLCPESRPTGSSEFQFVPAQKFPVCRQRCRLPAQANTRARSVRVIVPVRIESKDKMNARPSVEVTYLTVAVYGRG